MNRILAFSERNRKEILRDPLSYVFCAAFPLVMLVIMTIVQSSIPPQSGMTVFRIDNLSAGVAVFGQAFVMLFTALTVSKDRAGSFLVRMYATPMRPADFVAGYALPMLTVGAAQTILIYAASWVISAAVGTPLNPAGLLASALTLVPSCVMFIAFGALSGTLFSEKTAPGICSIIISLGSFLGCIWFDADATGGVMLKVCRALPFYYCTKSARSAVRLDFGRDTWLIPLLIVVLCAAALSAASSLAFKSRMRADLS